jgi:hypothetical protein
MIEKSPIETIGIGEDGFMLGLFMEYPGAARNAVAARFGNVSMLARDDLPIESEFRTRPCHLFDMRSRPGFSGSPVFVYRTPTADLRNLHRPTFNINRNSRGSLDARENTFIRLLGIHIGQFHDRVKVRKVKSPKSEPDEIFTIPNSMAIVVPAWSILALLDHNVFVEQREAREAEDAEIGAPTVTME